MIQMTPTMAEDAVVVKERLCFAERVCLQALRACTDETVKV
jgi:hypothetical protein